MEHSGRAYLVLVLNVARLAQPELGPKVEDGLQFFQPEPRRGVSGLGEVHYQKLETHPSTPADTTHRRCRVASLFSSIVTRSSMVSFDSLPSPAVNME